MSMSLTVNQFEDLNLFSNKNMEKVIGSIINESSNAVLVNMGEDAVIILDHTEGQFYIADYKFDREKLTLTLEGFEEIELTREEEQFEDKVYEYFDDDDASVTSLTESYKSSVLNQDKYITQLINDAMSRKSFDDYVDYKSIKEAVTQTDLESVNRPFFKSYKERLSTHPLSEVKIFDWENPVVVSLVETEARNIINRNAIQKANDLWKDPEFKSTFAEASKTFFESVEDGVDEYKELFESYPTVFFLDRADRKSLFGKAILGDSELRENIDDLLKGLDIVFEKFDLKDMADKYIVEAEEEGVDMEGGEEEPADAPPEVEEDDMEKLITDLMKVAEKTEDEDAKKKLDDLIKKYQKSTNEGTRVDLVKEAISLLIL